MTDAGHRRLTRVLRLGFPVIGVVDISRAVDFWAQALDLVLSDEWASETWRTLHHADGSGRALALQYSESPVEPHPRVHMDLFADSAAEQRAEVQRLVGLGAHELDWDLYPPHPAYVVLGDPDGNAFCIVDLSHAPSS